MIGPSVTKQTLTDAEVERTWALSLDSGQDEECGSVDGHGWFALFRADDTDCEPLEGYRAGLIIWQNGQGFKGGTGYHSTSALEEAWEECESISGGNDGE